jgi:hypothetical protein
MEQLTPVNEMSESAVVPLVASPSRPSVVGCKSDARTHARTVQPHPRMAARVGRLRYSIVTLNLKFCIEEAKLSFETCRPSWDFRGHEYCTGRLRAWDLNRGRRQLAVRGGRSWGEATCLDKLAGATHCTSSRSSFLAVMRFEWRFPFFSHRLVESWSKSKRTTSACPCN